MDLEEIRTAVDQAIDSIQREEYSWLERFYARPLEELRQIEQQELAQRAIGVPLAAQEALTAAMREKEVPYVNTFWKKISENLTPFSYTYIDWKSVEGQRRHQVKVSDEEFQRMKSESSNHDYLSKIATGAVAGGVTSAVISLVNFVFPSAGFPVLIPAIVVGTATALCVHPIPDRESGLNFQSVRKGNGGSNTAVGQTGGNTASAGKTVTAAAERVNKAAVDAWCKHLRNLTQQAVGEIET